MFEQLDQECLTVMNARYLVVTCDCLFFSHLKRFKFIMQFHVCFKITYKHAFCCIIYKFLL